MRRLQAELIWIMPATRRRSQQLRSARPGGSALATRLRMAIVGSVAILMVLAACSSPASSAGAADGSQAATTPTNSTIGSTAAQTAGSGSGGPLTGSSSTIAATNVPGPAAPREVPEGFGSGAADGEFPRSVVHFGGATAIPEPPTRVVVISTGQLDAALTLGVVPVGTTRGAGAELVPAYLSERYPAQAAELAALQDLGTRLEPNLEAIAAARPGLILVNSAGADGIGEQLSMIAPTVLTEGTGVNWKQDFLLVADALGRTQQAQGILDDFHATAEQHAAGSNEDTVSFVRTTSDRNRVFGVPSFVGSIAEDAGFVRPAGQQFEQTSQDVADEQLTVLDADWIFYGVQPGAETRSVAQNPLWATLGAVSAGHVVDVDDDMWYLNAGPTAAAAVLEQLISTVQ